jgi:hypothetical protein
MTQKRMAISLPEDLLNELEFVCLKAGVNRSALVCELIRPRVAELLSVFDDGVPVEEYVESMRRQRRRGDTSTDAVRSRMRIINQFLNGAVSDDAKAH